MFIRKNNHTLIFDFDRTVFDDDRFIGDFFNLFQRYGATKEELLVGYAKATSDGKLWDPIVWAGNIFFEIPPRLSNDIKILLENTDRYIYSDVQPFLAKNRAPKIMLSFGDENIQRTKISHSGIAHHFDPIVITQDKLKNNFFVQTSLRLDRTVFIDDRAAIIDSIKSNFPDVFCIRIKRPGSSYNNEPASFADREIENLFDLAAIV